MSSARRASENSGLSTELGPWGLTVSFQGALQGLLPLPHLLAFSLFSSLVSPVYQSLTQNLSPNLLRTCMAPPHSGSSYHGPYKASKYHPPTPPLPPAPPSSCEDQ
jgi:hypothetical protein